MRTATHALTLAAPKDKVFAFLSQVENLPKWAIHFCHGLRRDGAHHKVMTPGGEIFFAIDADAGTGVIDMRGGPSPDQMALWPARVVEPIPGRSIFLFTAIQYPGTADAEFARQCDLLHEEFELIRKHTETA